MKVKEIFLIVTLSFLLNLYAVNPEVMAETNRSLKNQNQVEVETTIKIPSASEESSTFDSETETRTPNWTMKNWQKHMQDNGLGTHSIGATQLNTRKMAGSELTNTANPNMMRYDSIQNNQEYSDIDSLNSFNDDLVNSMVSKTTSHDVTKDIFETTIKCYITRDLPITYKCGYTGLRYGDNINNDGFVAKNECEDECYEQYDSLEVIKEGDISNITMQDIALTTPTSQELADNITNQDFYINNTDESQKALIKQNYLKRVVSRDINISSIYNLTRITFNVELDVGKYVYATLRYVNQKDEDIAVFYNYKITSSDSFNFPINQVVKHVSLEVVADVEDVNLEIKDITLNYEGGSYICPHLQDISNKEPGQFAYLCPSGNTVNIVANGYQNYTLCRDYGTVGDNGDGTFSRYEMANNVCQEKHECKIDLNYINTTLLYGFREGCIQGQSGCSDADETCKELRIEKNSILNERVFDANSKIRETIVNEAQVAGVQRPRVLLNEDVSFQERTAEELKDEAYENMLQNKTYRKSKYRLNENTHFSESFAIGMSGGNYQGTSIRSLYWQFKPKAYDIEKDKKYYAIFDVLVRRKVINQMGKYDTIKDRIIYLKTDENNDYMKPIAKISNWGSDEEYLDDEGNVKIRHAENPQAYWEYKSFNTSTNQWFSHPLSQTAEYFKHDTLTLDNKPYERIKVINNLTNAVYIFPGIIRSRVTNGAYQTDIYTGNFDGNAEVVQKIVNYNLMLPGNEVLTYQNIVNMIENKEIEPTYDSIRYGTMKKNLLDDTEQAGDDIQLYMYGDINKKTAYLRAFPRKEDVGKYGFLYIFAVDEND
jgi:hypothetical protein